MRLWGSFLNQNMNQTNNPIVLASPHQLVRVAEVVAITEGTTSGIILAHPTHLRSWHYSAPRKALDFGGGQNGKWPVSTVKENEYFCLTV
jgi:hypothetical protein